MKINYIEVKYNGVLTNAIIGNISYSNLKPFS